MPHARSSFVDLSVTPYYHCISRCVRRAFLCGKDSYTGEDYSHRREWVRTRIHFLADVFAIDVCAYAVMSNHLHLVLHINKTAAQQWDNEEVIARYGMLFPMAVQAHLQPDVDDVSDSVISVWRDRLSDISWYMRSLNEHIARKANKEDDVTGRFWEGRFKSQPILDEAGLLTCMAYVDLNPIRAKMANSLETADFTSIQARLFQRAKADQDETRASILMPFADVNTQTSEILPFRFEEYLNVLSWTINLKLSECIDIQSLPALESYGVSPTGWKDALKGSDIETATFLSRPASLAH